MSLTRFTTVVSSPMIFFRRLCRQIARLMTPFRNSFAQRPLSEVSCHSVCALPPFIFYFNFPRILLGFLPLISPLRAYSPALSCPPGQEPRADLFEVWKIPLLLQTPFGEKGEGFPSLFLWSKRWRNRATRTQSLVGF